MTDKKNSLKRYVLKNFFLVFIALLLILLPSYLLLKTIFFELEKEKLKNMTKNIALNIGDHSYLTSIAKVYDIRITIIKQDGTVIFDSHIPSNLLENHKNREEVIKALNYGEGLSVRQSTSTGKIYLYYALSSERQNIVRVAKEKEELERVLYPYIKEIILSLILLLIIIFVMLYLSIKKKADNIDRIFNALINIATGKKAGQLSINKTDILYPIKEAIERLDKNIENLATEIENRKNILEVIFHNISFPLILFGGDRKTLIINEPFLKIFSNIKDIDEFNQLLRVIDINLKEVQEKKIFDIERAGRYFRLIFTPIEGYKERFFLISLVDITEIKKAEQMKAEFIANLSHELKTPITVIKGFVETLESEITADKRFMIEAIKKHILRLESLVKDILILYQLEEGKNILIERVNLIEIIDQVVGLFENEIKGKNIKIIKNYRRDIEMEGDSFLIIQAIANLLSNSIKFTEHSGEIGIILDDDERNVYISLYDTGCGIPEHLKEKIFERFFVVDKSRSRELGGTGLGLSIVKNIMDIHKGRVEYQPNKPKGSIFKLTFPKNSSIDIS